MGLAITAPSLLFAAFPPEWRLRAGAALRERHGDDLQPRAGAADLAGVEPEVGRGERRDLFLLGRHDPLERGIARMIDAGLDLQDGGEGHAGDLVDAALHLAGHLDRLAALLQLDAHDQPDVRQAEPAGEHRAGAAVADVVGLRAGEHEIEALPLHRGGKGAAGGEGVAAQEGGIGKVDGARRAEGERLAQRLFDALRPEAEHHHLAAGLLGELEPLLQSVFIALVDDERQVLFLQPPAVAADAQPGLGVGDLLDADGDLHAEISLGADSRRRSSGGSGLNAHSRSSKRRVGTTRRPPLRSSTMASACGS
jgi:hypothetical protein